MKPLSEMTQEERQAEYERQAAESAARHKATAVQLLKDEGYRVVKGVPMCSLGTGAGQGFLIKEEL